MVYPNFKINATLHAVSVDRTYVFSVFLDFFKVWKELIPSIESCGFFPYLAIYLLPKALDSFQYLFS